MHPRPPFTQQNAGASSNEFDSDSPPDTLYGRVPNAAIGSPVDRPEESTIGRASRATEVFHRSGVQVHETLDHGYVHLTFSVLPTEASVAHSELLDRLFTTASLRPLFRPTAVAVIG